MMESVVSGLKTLNLIISHPIFISTFTTWFIAQSIKLIIDYIKHKKLNFKLLIGTGGMPSSHTASVVALTVSVGLYDSFTSAAFMVSLGYCIVVISDAVGVRRAAGNQARILNMMLDDLEHHKYGTNRLKELLGHTPFEAVVGVLIGILFPVIFFNTIL